MTFALLLMVGCDDTGFGGGAGGGKAYLADRDGVTEFIEDQCAQCHPSIAGTDLVVDLFNQLEPGYVAGPDEQILVVPGEPDESLLWQVLDPSLQSVDAEGRLSPTPMPAGNLLGIEKTLFIKLWILEGASTE